jgi:plasmid stability protein
MLSQANNTVPWRPRRPLCILAAQLWCNCCIVLAFYDMKTLYLRNVPDDVSERLATLAAREGLSVSSFALRELAAAARRADNPALLGELPDLDVAAADVVADLDAARFAR